MKTAIHLCAALLLGVSAAVWGDSFSQGKVTVTHPWSRLTPPGVPVGVGYMVIANRGDKAITLLGATTPKAKSVTIHQSRMDDGMMSMRRLEQGLPIAAGETVRLAPGGYHLMLEGLTAAVGKGERIPLTLQFDGAEPLSIALDARTSEPVPHQH